MNPHLPAPHSQHSHSAQPHAVAALAFDMAAGSEPVQPDAAPPARLRVLPDGAFAAPDGRPGNMAGVSAPSWQMNAQVALAVIARFDAMGLELPIDYEHQTLKADTNGQPAPAAGWITALAHEPGVGLLADVRWTQAGARFVAQREYRYISPVFPFDKATGEVLFLHSLALTNKPGLTSLAPIAALAALTCAASAPTDFDRAPARLPLPLLGQGPGAALGALACRLPGLGSDDDGVTTMDKTQVVVALGLAPDVSDETALAALTALTGNVQSLTQQVAQLQATQFDAAQHLPLAEHQKVVAELAALKATQAVQEHGQLMAAALADARILPTNEPYWRGQPLAALQAFLETARPLAALAQTQTGGVPPAGVAGVAGAAGAAVLSADEQLVARALGQSAVQFAVGKA